MEELDYIASVDWFFGIRDKADLLILSAKQLGVRQKLSQEIGVDFSEMVLIDSKGDFPLRVLNSDQSSKVHAVIYEKLMKNELDLQEYIQKCNQLFLKDFNCEDPIQSFEKILECYKTLGVYFQIIFSAGLQLTKLGLSESLVKLHDEWRNTLAFKEERLYNSLISVIKVITKDVVPELFIKYLTIEEAQAFVYDPYDVSSIINKRMKDGFVFYSLRDFGFKAIYSDEIKDYFLQLKDQREIVLNNNILKGNVAYSDGFVVGKVVVVNDESELSVKDLKDKILVSRRTTPYFTPYLDKVKAFVTDEGGITSHAAIVAREMQKVCIVGTLVGTKLLKDGYLVEIDSTLGIVKILSKGI